MSATNDKSIIAKITENAMLGMKVKVILIVGSGRSGTSMLSHILQRSGCYLGGNLIAGDKFNKDGYFEDKTFVEFHKRVLRSFKHADGLGSAAVGIPSRVRRTMFRYKDELRSLVLQFVSEATSNAVVIKDPRATHLIPLWAQVIGELGWDLRLVLAFREPSATVASIIRANRCSPLFAESVYIERTYCALNSKKQVIVFDYDACLRRPRESIRRLLKSLDLDASCLPTDVVSGTEQIRKDAGNTVVLGTTKRIYTALSLAAKRAIPIGLASVLVNWEYRKWKKMRVLHESIAHEATTRINSTDRRSMASKVQRAQAAADAATVKGGAYRWFELQYIKAMLPSVVFQQVANAYGFRESDRPSGDRMRILYVGPDSFVKDEWGTGAGEVFDARFEALGKRYEIHLLTRPVPDFAQPGLSELCAKYGVIHVELGEKRAAIDLEGYWLQHVLKYAQATYPVVIENLSGEASAYAGVLAAKIIGCRSVFNMTSERFEQRKASIHEESDGTAELRFEDRPAVTATLALCDEVIVASQGQRQDICERLVPSYQQKVRVSVRG